MEVVIRSQNVPISQALEEHCHERVVRALQPFREHVRRVDVVLVDLNGPKHGPAQACRVFVDLRRGGTVMFASAADTFYHSASTSAAGAARHLSRVLERARTRTLARVDPLGAA